VPPLDCALCKQSEGIGGTDLSGWLQQSAGTTDATLIQAALPTLGLFHTAASAQQRRLQRLLCGINSRGHSGLELALCCAASGAPPKLLLLAGCSSWLLARLPYVISMPHSLPVLLRLALCQRMHTNSSSSAFASLPGAYTEHVLLSGPCALCPAVNSASIAANLAAITQLTASPYPRHCRRAGAADRSACHQQRHHRQQNHH